MKNFRILLAALCLSLVALSACDNTQKREEAINRGEGPVQTSAHQCQLVHGKWLGDARGCKITQKACAAVGGTWAKKIGCIAATAEPDGCSNASGVAVVDGQCAIAELSATDLDYAWTCHAAQGQWLADTRRCGMTAHLCEQSTDAVWQPGIGCKMPSTADQCVGMSGLHVINDQCIMVDLSREDLEGSEDVARARSKLHR